MRILASLAALLALALPSHAQVSDKVVTSTLSATGAVNITLEGRQGVSVLATGTCTGLSFAPQVSANGTTWVTARMYDVAANTFAASGGAGTYVILPTSGMMQARINITVLSASCDFTLRATAAAVVPSTVDGASNQTAATEQGHPRPPTCNGTPVSVTTSTTTATVSAPTVDGTFYRISVKGAGAHCRWAATALTTDGFYPEGSVEYQRAEGTRMDCITSAGSGTVHLVPCVFTD